ncbi:PVC-type heme-binding CxxCH protein [Chitinophaga defluvii]|uniref:PVC-type heme-binding CxxCH protein n=1 Tax=Chitinophaga defluvii TaxID=3163343 RepID=A0ABV2T1D3_9BACT
MNVFHYALPVLAAGVLLSCQSNRASQAAVVLTEEEKHLPENALYGLQAAANLQVGLFAHEPMLVNPTNIDIDAKGRVWVCEGFNYRNPLNPSNPYHPKGDRIMILEDTDHDGKADKQTVFYQGPDVNSALGIAVLGNKVIVSRSPNVLLFTDENGDGVADKKDTLFTHLGGEHHDHAIHAFSFGPDGKLYFNFGNEGHELRDKYGNPVKDVTGNIVKNDGHPYRQGMVFRCNTDGSEVEVLGHNFRNNYEVAVDAYGTLWQSDNDDDGNKGVRINYVMPYGNYGYTDEMTGASWSDPRLNREDSIPFRHWHLNDPGVVPNLLQTGAGSPTGILVYEGKLLPERFRNQLIHADAGPNVVRSYALTEDGAGYKATINNIVEGTGDNWFRPSDVCVAPDGSVFIADWYDPGVGGHQVGDLARGRIFRVTPSGDAAYKVPAVNLDTPEGAVKALESPNLATRYLGWMQLMSLGDNAIPALKKEYRSDNSRYRARALWLLSKLPAGNTYIQEALKDKDANIRITALRAGLQLKGDTIALVKQLVNDGEPAVRREAVIALRHNSSPAAPELWAQLARQYDGKDRWYLEALGIGADKQWEPFFNTWMKTVDSNWNTATGRDIVWRSRATSALPLLAKIITDPANDPDKSVKYFRAFDFHPEAGKLGILLSLLQAGHPQQARINVKVLGLLDPAHMRNNPVVQQALKIALAGVANPQEYLDLVGYYELKDKAPELLAIIRQTDDTKIQAAAMRLLLQLNGSATVQQALRKSPDRLIAALGAVGDKPSKDLLQQVVLNKQYSLKDRTAATTALGKGRSGEERLLQLLKKHQLPDDVKSVAVTIFKKTDRPEVREAASKYLDGLVVASSKLPPVADLLKMKGNATSGAAVFEMYCSTCHVVNNKGTDFGPNLSEIGSKLSAEAMYKAILSPSAGISFGFEGYNFKLANGTTLSGYIASQTEDDITIKVIGGISEKHKKAEIVEKKPLTGSLMPDGLGEGMGTEKLADVVAYIEGLRKG